MKAHEGELEGESPRIMTSFDYHRHELMKPIVGTAEYTGTVGDFDIEEDAYALSRSGLDLFARGLFRGLS